MSDLRYPIGRFHAPETIGPQDLQDAIDAIAALPQDLRTAIRGLNQAQLDTPYRPDGWTVRQVVHHVADSHINSYIRFRLALTEDGPAIPAYDEKAWAELTDAERGDPELSLNLLDFLHRRWTMLLRSLTEIEWQKTFKHPERGSVRLDNNALLYAWHGRHHVAHIAKLRERMHW